MIRKKYITYAINIRGNLISDKSQVVNAFKSYFTGSVGRLISLLGFSFIEQNNFFNSEFFNNLTKNSFKFTPVSEQLAVKFLRKCRVQKATGLDRIPAPLMRGSASAICNLLTKIINASLQTGHVPTEWKTARVLPLFKSCKTADLDNNQPISILPFASCCTYTVVYIFD